MNSERLIRFNDESKTSLKNSLVQLNQSKEIGIATFEELEKQGEKIKKAEHDIETIEQHNKQAEKHLRGIRSIFGSIINRFTTTNYSEDDENRDSQSISIQTNTTTDTKFNNISPSNNSFSDADLIQGYDVDSEILREQIHEQDEMLDEISSVLHQLNSMAKDMNTEILHQYERLENLSENVDKQNRTINKHNKEIHKLLRKF